MTKPLLEIVYCHECGYLPEAAILAEKMLQEFSRKLGGVTLIPGSKGQFEVSLDGAPVFSKIEKGRFPDNKEIRDAIRAG